MMEGLCKYESYLDGSLSLNDVARLNHLLDVRRENELRIRESEKD